MASIPFIGRLSLREYPALLLSLLLILLESLIRIITLLLPSPIESFFYARSRTLFKLFHRRSTEPTPVSQKLVHRVRDAAGFVELCSLFGYVAEEHIVQTKDGYLLGVHRLRCKRGVRTPPRDLDVRKGDGKRVVYLHHGLLMNSEVWVCLLEEQKCLPFVLVERGFDVWLGNNRGNKYSKKCLYSDSSSTKFWNFCIDDFAMHDIPDTISYILDTTGQPSLTYVGFSQGTAQAFAALSIHPTLNAKVDSFIALAPAMSPKGLHNRVVDALMKTSPNIMFLLFGRRSILASTTFWQSILYPPLFVGVIDRSLAFLFNWTGNNIAPQQKLASYAHLYSFTSVKSVVHWFQIMRNASFQMYDDDLQTPVSLGRSFYKVARFPTKNITAPTVLIYGGADSLVDIHDMLRELPEHTVVRKINNYEHLDFLWARDVEKKVIPFVLEALDIYSPDTAGQGRLKNRRRGNSAFRRPLENEADDIDSPTASTAESTENAASPQLDSNTSGENKKVSENTKPNSNLSPTKLNHSPRKFSISSAETDSSAAGFKSPAPNVAHEGIKLPPPRPTVGDIEMPSGSFDDLFQMRKPAGATGTDTSNRKARSTRSSRKPLQLSPPQHTATDTEPEKDAGYLPPGSLSDNASIKSNKSGWFSWGTSAGKKVAQTGTGSGSVVNG